MRILKDAMDKLIAIHLSVCRIMILIILIISVYLNSVQAQDTIAPQSLKQSFSVQKTWLDSIQIYSHLTIPIKKAQTYGVTVNGLWNGWGTESPVASLVPDLILWRFLSNRSYVERVHKGGMRLGATIPCIYAHLQIFQAQPKLENAVCRTLDGEFFQLRGAWSWYIGRQRWMCQNHPFWQEALLDRAKKIIQAESDLILLDEQFGDTYASSLPVPGIPGFSKWDLQLLAQDLEANYDISQREVIFGLSSITQEDLRAKLEQVEWEKWMNASETVSDTTQADRLWMRFKVLQRKSNFESKKKLVEAIREYSKQVRNVEIPIGANLAELEAFSLGTQQLPVLNLAELFDFIAYEMVYRPILSKRGFGKGETWILPHRGKWMPWHKLGVSIVGPHRSLAYPSQNFTDWISKTKRINYLCHLFAEAYAGQGALILILTEVKEMGGQDKMRLYTQFIKQHSDFYQNSTMVAPIGIVYSYGPETTARQWSYLGLAQALYESGLPFSVIYSTQDGTRWNTLSQSVLNQYKLLFLPTARTLNQKQNESISEYVSENGGIVVLLDSNHSFAIPQESGYHQYGAGGFVVMTSAEGNSTTQTIDPGEAYYNSYSDEYRQVLAEAALAHLPENSPVVLPETERKWSVIAYSQFDKERAVIHVLNYDYNHELDNFRPKNDLTIRVNPSAFGLSQNGDFICTAYSPERTASINLDYKWTDSYLEIKIPELQIYEVLVLSSSKEKH